MTNLICHLCGHLYTDKEGHDYEECIGICVRRVLEVSRELRDLERKYAEACKIAGERRQESEAR